MTKLQIQDQLKNALAEIERLKKENEILKNQLLNSSHKTFNNGTNYSIDHSAKSEEKIKIYRKYFKGREDVYAKRWTNRKGVSGYSPACYYEWDPIKCQKPKSRCENCSYIPVNDDVIRKHLLGEICIGIYPILKDEKCWFLAVDFDKTSWKYDVEVFATTCNELDIPFAVERSRSGNGCHVWFFFIQPIPVSTARKFGSGILTLSIEKRHQIGLDSYDRLFPNQDTLPKGGLGNLIALPLQGKSRKEDNTVFVNHQFEPYSDQWEHLSNVHKISSEKIGKTIKTIEKTRFSTTNISKASVDEPWTIAPSGPKIENLKDLNIPEKINIVNSNLIFIDKSKLPPALINRLVRLAAFQNPEFYKAQAMRLSTFGKPRIIKCAEEHKNHIGLPRGTLDPLLKLLSENKIKFEITDKRNAGIPIKTKFLGKLRVEQLEISKKILNSDLGVLSLPTAFGKTVIALWLIVKRRTNTLILVHRKQLQEQWLTQLSFFLDLQTKNIGKIGGGKTNPSKIVDVGLIQSLSRKGIVNDIVTEYGQVIIDECHHVPAFSFESILKQVKAKYVLGLTATPVRKDGHHPIIIMQSGPVVHQIKKQLSSISTFRRQVVIRNTSFRCDNVNESSPIQAIYAELTKDDVRNDLIFNDILLALEQKRSPLLLTERKFHLDYFADRLKSFAKNIIVLKGGMSSNELRNVMKEIKSIPDQEERLILATGRYIGEGFDDGRLDTLFLVMPISWKGTLQQYVGRLHRNHVNKDLVQVFDYVDINVPMLSKMYKKRLRGYRSLGYNVD